MSKNKEVLRLLNMGLSQRAVASSAHVSTKTVSIIVKNCRDHSISYAEALLQADDGIEERKRKEVKLSGARRPDCEHIHKELTRKGVTLKILHDEYVDECVQLGTDYLKYTQFCNVYKDYVEDQKLTMHIERKPGERMEVDWL